MTRDAMKISIAVFILLGLLYGCGGGGAGVADVPPGVNPGQVSLLKLMPDRNVAQTGSFAYFHARVLDGNGMPISGKTVNFTNMTTGVTLSATSAVTDRDGIAKVAVRMTNSGYATVIAESEGHRDRRSLLFTSVNSIRGFALNPIIVLLDADRNLNGTYNEADDFKVCQGPNTNVVRVKATTYVMGVKQGGMRIGITADYPTLITFPNTPMLDQITNTYYLTTNPMGEATVDITVNCQLQPNELLFNIFATTDLYYIEDFDLSFIGTGGMSLFLQPVTVTGILLTADPATAMVGGTSQIRATVNTTIGPAPDNTAVQLYTTCGTISPTPAMTLNGVATAVFTAPSYIPTSGTCSVVAKVGSQTATVSITITGQLAIMPESISIDGTTGGIATFTVIGGVPIYNVYSNNPAFAPTPATLATSGSSFTITVPASTAAQTVTITVRDSQGTTATATLNITAAGGGEGGQSTLTISPTSVTMGSNETAAFVITGGTAPYTVTSSRPSLLFNGTPGTGTWTVSASGGSFVVTSARVTTDTDVTLTVVDSNGRTATAKVTISAAADAQLSVSPANVTVTGTSDATDQVTFIITGGTGPFNVYTSNAIVVPPPIVSGRNFTINPAPVGKNTAVTLTAVDTSNGSTVTVTVNVTPAITNFVINPSEVEMTQNYTLTFYIIGGTGPFNVVSGKEGIATVNGGATASLAAGVRQFTVKAGNTAGSVIITVIDTVGGASAQSTVKVN